MAWDKTGHRLIGELAQQQLSPKALSWVKSYLSQEEIFSASHWADEIRSDPSWKRASSWHYLNCPFSRLLSERTIKKEGDLLQAMEAMMNILLKRKVPKPYEKVTAQEALKFLIHFVGDLHQPFHVGLEEDRGGNDVMVFWFGEKTNLHQLWDQGLIDHQKLSFSEWSRFIHGRLPKNLRKKTKQSLQHRFEQDFFSWALESRAVLKNLYEKPRSSLGYDYAFKHLPLLIKQLYLSGERLAMVLEYLAERVPGHHASST
jgi:hypothetical protein